MQSRSRQHRKTSRRAGVRASVPVPATRWIADRMPAALLVGASIGLLAVGFVESVYSRIGFTPVAGSISLPLLALVLSLGIWMTLRVHRVPAIPVRVVRVAEDHHARSDEGRRLRAAVASLAAALGVLLLPEWGEVAGRIHAAACDGFLWSWGSRVVLDGAVIAIAAGPVLLVGVAFVLVGGSRVCPSGRAFGTTVAILVGAGLVLISVGAFESADIAPGVRVRLAAIPLLLCAMTLLAGGRTTEPAIVARPRKAVIEEPELRNRWPTLLRLVAGIAITGAGVTGAMWTHVIVVMYCGSLRATHAAIGVLLIVLAAGLWCAPRRADAGRRIASCGASCSAAGAAVAFGTLVFASIIPITDDPFRYTSGFVGLWWLCACPAMLLCGRAIGCLQLAVSRRVATRTPGDEVFNIAMLVCGSFGISLIAWILLRHLGSYTALAAAALAFLACGGVLIIHDPRAAAGRRAAGIAVVFATVLMMTATLPLARGGWLRSRQQRDVVMTETWWGAVVASDVGPVSAYARSMPRCRLTTQRIREAVGVASSGEVAVVGTVAGWPEHAPATVDPVAAAGLNTSGDILAGRDHYDVVVIALSGLADDLVRRICAGTLIESLAGRLTPDGVLVVVLSDSEALAPMRRSFAARLAQRGRVDSRTLLDREQFNAILFRPGGRPAVRLLADRSGATANDHVP